MTKSPVLDKERLTFLTRLQSNLAQVSDDHEARREAANALLELKGKKDESGPHMVTVSMKLPRGKQHKKIKLDLYKRVSAKLTDTV